MFGSNYKKIYEDQPVVQRFTRRSKDIDRHIKSIVCTNDVIEYGNPHYPQKLSGGVQVNSSKQIINGPFNELNKNDNILIFHYWCKSEEEFRDKIERGNADGTNKRDFNDFISFNNSANEILDLRAYKFFFE